MAVSRLQDWNPVETSSDGPNNKAAGFNAAALAGTNRVLIFVHSTEVGSDYSASCAFGGMSADGRGGTFWESGGAGDLSIKYWYWNETSIAAMSATTSISWTETEVLSKQAWSWAVFGSVDQTTPVAYDSSVDSTVSSSQPMTIPTPGESGDYTIVWGHRDSANREFATDGTLTEIYDVDANASKAGLFDGAWASAVETIRGEDETAQVMLLGSLVLNQYVAVASISGAGSVDGLIATIAGVGERKIVGNMSATAVAAIVSAVGTRIITATGSASGPVVVVYGSDSGGFVVAVPVSTVMNDDAIGKSVAVQGL